MKSIFIQLALILCALPALACKCRPQAPLINLSQLDRYSFIALVTIKDDGDRQGSNVLQFTVKELFKGVSRNNILESAKNTSCDLYIAKGQEWLIFGVLTDGKLYMNPCDRNQQHRNENPAEDLRKLRELYHPDSPRVSYYKNGQKKIEENYLKGRLHGERKTWFENGQLKTKDIYVNGLKEGKSESFFSSGALMEDRFYKAGKNHNIWRSYFGDSLPAGVNKGPVFVEEIYNTDGEAVVSRIYYRSGQTKSESFMQKKNGYNISIDYHPNGVVKFIQNWNKGKPLEQYQRYDEQGIPFPSKNWMNEYDLHDEGRGNKLPLPKQ